MLNLSKEASDMEVLEALVKSYVDFRKTVYGNVSMFDCSDGELEQFKLKLAPAERRMQLSIGALKLRLEKEDK